MLCFDEKWNEGSSGMQILKNLRGYISGGWMEYWEVIMEILLTEFSNIRSDDVFRDMSLWWVFNVEKGNVCAYGFRIS